jgi:ribonuclease HI
MSRSTSPGHGAKIVVNFDGLCEPKNPGGVATYGIVVREGERKIHEESGLAYAKPWTDEASNNVAEYSALIHALEWLETNGYRDSEILIRGDSKLIINQLNGKFKVKAPRIVELFHRARELSTHFRNVKVEWVDRSLNKEADLLSRIAYSRFTRPRARNPEA